MAAKTLWLLTRVETPDEHLWMDWTDRVVVRADDETTARLLAAMRAAATDSEEGPAAWTDPERSTCVVLDGDGPDEVVVAQSHEITPYR